DPPLVEVHDAVRLVPDAHAVGEVVSREAVEHDHGPALERYPQLGGVPDPLFEEGAHAVADRVDADDVAEPDHERPAEIHGGLAPGEPQPEETNLAAALGRALARHQDRPGISLSDAVEVVAPERLLIASETQPALVGRTSHGGDA